MNINNVYECEIWRVVSCDTFMSRTLQVQFNSVFLKKALVYRKNTGVNVDLNTGEMYPMQPTFGFEFYINCERPITSISAIIEVERKSMTKGKILRKYTEQKNKVGNI